MTSSPSTSKHAAGYTKEFLSNQGKTDHEFLNCQGSTESAIIRESALNFTDGFQSIHFYGWFETGFSLNHIKIVCTRVIAGVTYTIACPLVYQQKCSGKAVMAGTWSNKEMQTLISIWGEENNNIQSKSDRAHQNQDIFERIVCKMSD